MRTFDHAGATNGDLVPANVMADALTAAPLVFPDGSTQTFTPDGNTVYIEQGRPTEGEWAVVEDGTFSSFWPPTYRATYSLTWIVDDASVVGLSFTEAGRGQRFDGRYQ